MMATVAELGAASGHRAHLRGARGCRGRPTTAAGTAPRAAAAAGATAGAPGGRAAGGARRPARAALRGPGAGRGLRDAARRGPLPVLEAHAVPRAGRQRRGARAARPAAASALRRARAAGHAAERAVELGHHQAARARRSGPTSTSTSCSTCSAATSVGWMLAHRESAALAEKLIARELRRARGSSPASSPCTPTAARR